MITIHTSEWTNFVFSSFLFSLPLKTDTSFSILFLALAKPDLVFFVQCSITYLCIYQWHTIVNITAWRPGKSCNYLASSFAIRRHNAMHFRLSMYSRSSLYRHLSITISLQLRSHHSITVSTSFRNGINSVPPMWSPPYSSHFCQGQRVTFVRVAFLVSCVSLVNVTTYILTTDRRTFTYYSI